MMPKIIEAIYENGVFKPLEKVELRDGEKVRLRVDDRGYSLTQNFLISLIVDNCRNTVV
jgi:predicted DNA-binding antitoxin AbrB/MazE fold protein